MKRTFTLIATLVSFCVISAVFSSCGGFFGVDLTDQKSVDEYLRKNIEKFVTPENIVVEINMIPINSDGGFSTKMDQARVAHFLPDDEELLSYDIMLGGADKDVPKETLIKPSHLRKAKPADGMKLKDIDFSKIASNVQKATEIMQELFAENELEGQKFDGIGHYTITLNSDPSKVTHEFELQSIEGKERGTKNGRNVVTTNYYKLEFVADAEGNVELKD